MERCALAILILITLTANALYAQCIGLAKGPVVFDVNSCKTVVPKEDFSPKADMTFYEGMTAPDKARFLTQYQGLKLDGLVVKSSAVKKDIEDTKGALNGKKITVFLKGAAKQCQELQGKRLNVVVEEICCSGGAEAPCLLDTPYLIANPQLLGEAGSAAGDSERTATVATPEFREGAKAFKEKKYAEAAKLFEGIRRSGKLDVRGHFYLGLAYRNLDQCKKAIPVLSVVFDRANKKDVWADQAAIVRRSNFLLARCYAKVNDPGRATIILNAYLIEPQKYKEEIEQSLKNADFGYINASKEYRDYVDAARKKQRESRK